MSKALKKWLNEEAGRTTQLAKYLGVSQPAVTKMIQAGNWQDRRYARKIMEFTRIPAKDLFPFWVDIFEYSKDVQDEKFMEKKKDLEAKMKALKSQMDILLVDEDINAKDIEDHFKSIGLTK